MTQKHLFLALLFFCSFIHDSSSMDLYDIFAEEVIYITNNIILPEKDLISLKCIDKFAAFITANTTYSELYIKKLLLDSSFNKNDAHTYYDCKNKKHHLDVDDKSFNVTYLLVTINRENLTKSENETNQIKAINKGEDDWFMIGICVPKIIECSNKDYAKIIRIFSNYSNIFGLNNTIVIEPSLTWEDPEVTVMKIEYKVFPELYIGYYSTYIPVLILLIYLFLLFFSLLPFCIFKKFFKNEIENLDSNSIGRLFNNEDNPKEILKQQKKFDPEHQSDDFSDTLLPSDESKSNINQGMSMSTTNTRKTNNTHNYQSFLFFRYTLTPSYNSEELFNLQVIESDINNDNGLKYIRGMRGLCMITYTFGFLFLFLFNTPNSFRDTEMFQEILESPMYSFFYFGLRYSPRILLSISGYILFFKFMSFLDECYSCVVDEKKLLKIENKQRKKDKSNHTNKELKRQRLESISKYESFERMENDIKNTFLNAFLLYQGHKLVMLIFTILFLRFSFYNLVQLIFWFNTGSMWEYLKEKVLKANLTELLMGISMTYFFPIKGEKKNELFISYLWLVFNEVIYFLLTCFFLFIGYKFKMKISKFLRFLVLITLFLKFVCFWWLEEFNNNEGDFYNLNSFGAIFVHPFYNYIYYLIGVYMGSLNYVLQNQLSSADTESEEKPFLISSIKVVNYFKLMSKAKMLFWMIFSIIIVISCSMYHFILLKIAEYRQLLLSSFYNIFLLYDVELVVLMVHIFAFACYVKGDNTLNSFLSGELWSIPNKIYFSFLINMTPVTMYVLFISERRTLFSLSNCFFYSIICGFFITIVSIICYIFVEAPLKRVAKRIFRVFQEEEQINQFASFSKEYKKKFS